MHFDDDLLFISPTCDISLCHTQDLHFPSHPLQCNHPKCVINLSLSHLLHYLQFLLPSLPPSLTNLFNKHLNSHSPYSHRQWKQPDEYRGIGSHTLRWAYRTPAPLFHHTTVHSYHWPHSGSYSYYRTSDRHRRSSSYPQNSAK